MLPLLAFLRGHGLTIALSETGSAT
jgi:hypothetical protein